MFADQVHNQNAYVRDFYFFRRNIYPQLSLVRMDPDDAALALQKRVSEDGSLWLQRKEQPLNYYAALTL